MDVVFLNRNTIMITDKNTLNSHQLTKDEQYPNIQD